MMTVNNPNMSLIWEDVKCRMELRLLKTKTRAMARKLAIMMSKFPSRENQMCLPWIETFNKRDYGLMGSGKQIMGQQNMDLLKKVIRMSRNKILKHNS